MSVRGWSPLAEAAAGVVGETILREGVFNKRTPCKQE